MFQAEHDTHCAVQLETLQSRKPEVHITIPYKKHLPTSIITLTRIRSIDWWATKQKSTMGNEKNFMRIWPGSNRRPLDGS